MSLIEELRWRGMIQDITPDTEDALNERPRIGYIGFDPTAPSLTIGNYVQVMLLTFFQKYGHTPVVLMGGATGRIGDPSGKDEERQLKSVEEIDQNLQHQLSQIQKFLDFDPSRSNHALLVNNYDFYKDMNVLDFLRDVGKHLTINYMMSKESVKKRLETGISFTEFSYQLIQGYDFLQLYKKYGVEIQMGGSDQWGNITAGTEMIRRFQAGPAYAFTTPLLTRADGKKFGKSEEGNIWLDPKMTSPYKFYQFWINADDADVPKFFRYFSLRSREEIERVDQRILTEPNEVKKELAEELTIRVHSKEACLAVQSVSRILFDRNADHDSFMSLTVDALEAISEEIPSHKVPKDKVRDGIAMSDLLCELSPVFSSRGECRRAIQGNAVSINKVKYSDHEASIPMDSWRFEKYLMVENGKKNKYLLVLQD